MLVGSDGTLMLRRALWDLSVGVGVDQLCAHHGLPVPVASRSASASASGELHAGTNSGGSGSGSSTAARWACASDSSTRQTGPLTGTGLAGSTCSRDTRTGPGPGGDSESAARPGETGCASVPGRVEPESVRAQPATGSVASGTPGTASGSESGVDADLEGLGGVCEAIRAEVVAGLENGLPMLAQ
jgi:hypothetical protein